MSYSISALLTRNLQDVFGENDSVRRRSAINEIFTEDCVFYDPGKNVYRAVANFLPFKRRCLKDTSRHAFQATNSCAIAYSYARIRRLVRLGGGFYCGPVAECSVIGFSSPGYL